MDASRFDPGVSRRLLSFLASASAGTLAAFDGDGTLWSRDVGEAFLRHVGEQGVLPAWREKGAAWAEYERRMASGDLRHAFELCVTAFAGVQDQEVAAWAEAFVRPAWKEYLFPGMRELLRGLREQEADIWIVSASPAWCVLPVASLLEIPEARVIAALPRTDAEGRVLADGVRGELPMGETKVRALVAAAGRPPHFAAGNSSWDYDLLESARVMAMLVNPPDDGGWRERRNAGNWLVQRFDVKETPST